MKMDVVGSLSCETTIRPSSSIARMRAVAPLPESQKRRWNTHYWLISAWELTAKDAALCG